MNTKRIIKRKKYPAVGIIIIFCLILAGCWEIEIEAMTVTIYRNPNGNAIVTWQLSNIKSNGGNSEEQLEEDYELIMSIFNKGVTPFDDSSPKYAKIWINDDGFLELLIESEVSEQKLIEKEALIFEENTIMMIFEKIASDEKNFTTNGEKIIDGDDLIIQWPIEARILKVSKPEPHSPYTDDWLAYIFIQRNPEGVVEKHFD